MPNNLQNFILNTLQPHFNNPANALWLPGQLQHLKDKNGKPLLPFHIAHKGVGDIKGSAGSLITQVIVNDWAVENNVWAIAQPSDPSPSLDLTDLTITGLENLSLESHTATANPNKTGYQSQAVFRFNSYQHLSQLKITGSFNLQQALCSCKSPTSSKCDGKIQKTLQGMGTFEAQITDCFLDAHFTNTVTGKGPNRAAAVSLTALKIRGQSAGSPPNITFPVIKMSDSNQAWIQSASQEGLNSEEATSGLLAAIQDSLNQKSTLAALSQKLTAGLAKEIDDIFSPIPASGLPTDGDNQRAATALDLYLFDRLRVAVNNPAARCYLPWLLMSSQNPVLDPYTAKTVTIPNQTIGGLQYTDIKLEDVSFASTSNAIAPLPQFLLDSNKLSAVFQLGTSKAGPPRTVKRGGKTITTAVPPAPPLVLTGNFTFTQQGFKPVIVTGKVIYHLTNVEVGMDLHPSGTAASNLVLTIQNLTLSLGTGNSPRHRETG